MLTLMLVHSIHLRRTMASLSMSFMPVSLSWVVPQLLGLFMSLVHEAIQSLEVLSQVCCPSVIMVPILIDIDVLETRVFGQIIQLEGVGVWYNLVFLAGDKQDWEGDLAYSV